MALINRDFFFLQVRRNTFNGSMRQTQVDGLNGLLDGWESTYAGDDDRWLAYALATTFHETDQKMQPIEEYGKGRGRPYGKPSDDTGLIYYGRGFVQLTWEDNYAHMSKEVGEDLVAQPELALRVDVATKILFVGMIKGLFSGKGLEHYFNANTDDWIGARRIINGQDRAKIIATYGHQFYAALSYTK